jgi:hypothetical protein
MNIKLIKSFAWLTFDMFSIFLVLYLMLLLSQVTYSPFAIFGLILAIIVFSIDFAMELTK